MKLKTIACVSAMLLCGWAQAQQGVGLSVLIERGQQNDRLLAAARASRNADVENLPIARAGLFPNISASVQSGHTSYERQDTGVAAPKSYAYNNSASSLRFQQPLYDRDAFAAVREGTARAQRGETLLLIAKQDLAIRLSTAYFNALLALDSMELATAQRVALQAQRERAESLYKGGLATVTDVEETVARLALATAQEEQARAGVGLRRADVERIVGPLNGVPLRPANFARATVKEAGNLADWIARAREQNLSVVAQRQAAEVANAQFDRSSAGHWPSVALTAGITRNSDPNYFTQRESTTDVGVRVSIPIFAGGRVDAQSRQAAATREKAVEDLANAVLEAESKTREAYLALQTGVGQVTALEQAVKSSEIALKGMESGQKVGFRTNTDVLSAQQQLYSARRDLQKERYSHLLAGLQLRAAAGEPLEPVLLAIDQ